MTRATSGFVLSASITVLFSTVLACVKDVNAPLKAFLKSIAGHDWTTQGLIDLVLFIVLGFIFTKVGALEKLAPDRLIAVLIAAVVIAALGLSVWFAFV
ncbi:MAG TPA: hypothetical protein VK724_10990 [Bryobacteraceae bacterium]|jgi:hypothetical protein|nr:hypothetical protein [Bryobacteraceae bacterium]